MYGTFSRYAGAMGLHRHCCEQLGHCMAATCVGCSNRGVHQGFATIACFGMVGLCVQEGLISLPAHTNRFLHCAEKPGYTDHALCTLHTCKQTISANHRHVCIASQVRPCCCVCCCSARCPATSRWTMIRSWSTPTAALCCSHAQQVSPSRGRCCQQHCSSQVGIFVGVPVALLLVNISRFWVRLCGFILLRGRHSTLDSQRVGLHHSFASCLVSQGKGMRRTCADSHPLLP